MGSFSGYTLFANITKYKNPLNDRGSPADNTLAQNYFGLKVNFEIKCITEDPSKSTYITKSRFETELDNAIATTIQKGYPKLIVAIVSHGSENRVNGKFQQCVCFYDENVSIDEVLFKRLSNPGLEQVEKIVWLEMCRVNDSDTKYDEGVPIKLVDDIKDEKFGQANAPTNANANVTEHQNPNLPPNCVVMFGTPSGKYSYTGGSRGSRSLVALREVMSPMKKDEEIDILSLLTKVIWSMSKNGFIVDLGGNTGVLTLSNNGSVMHRLTKKMKLKIHN